MRPSEDESLPSIIVDPTLYGAESEPFARRLVKVGATMSVAFASGLVIMATVTGVTLFSPRPGCCVEAAEPTLPTTQPVAFASATAAAVLPRVEPSRETSGHVWARASQARHAAGSTAQPWPAHELGQGGAQPHEEGAPMKGGRTDEETLGKLDPPASAGFAGDGTPSDLGRGDEPGAGGEDGPGGVALEGPPDELLEPTLAPAPRRAARSDRSESRRVLRGLLRAGSRALERGDLSAADAYLRQALEERPGHPEALASLARVALGRGRTSDARRLARDAVQRAPEQASYHMTLGDALRASGELRKADLEYAVAAQLSGMRHDQAQVLPPNPYELGPDTPEPTDGVGSARRAIRGAAGSRDGRSAAASNR